MLKRLAEASQHKLLYFLEEIMRATMLAVAVSSTALCACAGRDPQPIATVQPQDTYASCGQITAEIQANNIKVQELADEQGRAQTHCVQIELIDCTTSFFHSADRYIGAVALA